MLPRYLGSALDFFDVFLKGRDTGIQRVRWHQGNDGWRTAPSWPPPGARELRFHLAAADRAAADVEGGRLVAAPDATTTTARWVHDPADLVPSTVVDPFAFLRELPDEQREVIVLRVWGQMTFEEAATALEISPNTAASRYRYGLAKLKERLQPLPKE